MKCIKCKNCVYLDRCPCGQIFVKHNKEFARYCKIGKAKGGAENGN